MKKTLLASLCVVGVSAASFGQGYVNWNTIVPTYISAETNSTSYTSLLSTSGTPQNGTVGQTVASSQGLTYYFCLLYAPAGTAAPTTAAGLSAWTSTGLYAINSAAHNLSPSSVASPSSGSGSSTQLPWANGTTEEVMIAGWSANISGANWATVLSDLQNWSTAQSSVLGSAFFGLSNEGQFDPNSAAPGNTPFGTAASGLINSPNMQLDLLPTPEPATMALAAIGGASLLLFRRKK